MKPVLLRLLCAAAATTLAMTSFATPALAANTGLDGTITNALTGEPVAGAGIVIQHPDGSGYGYTSSDSAGHYDFPEASGSYVVRVTAANYVEQTVNATAPGTTDIAVTPIQYGSVSGRAIKHGGGAVPNVQVELYRGYNSVAHTTTGSDGRYVFSRVETGTYTMKFVFPSGQTLWYDNTFSEFQRKPFQVTPNADTVVNVTRPPVGTLAFKAVDKATGRRHRGRRPGKGVPAGSR